MDQLLQSAKKWNEEQNLSQWETFYHEDSYNGNRLRSREQKVLEFLDRLKLRKGSHVLELGYGAGVTSAKICARGMNLVGIDISHKLRELAIKNCKACKGTGETYRFLVGNAEKLDFEDNSFHCVVGLGFLQYLEHPTACIKEACRVLKPGGYFIIAQRNMFGISSIDGPIKLLRSVYYIVSRRRYELRWQDTALYWPAYFVSTIFSPLSARMHSLHNRLKDHNTIGLVRKNAFSRKRLKNLVEAGGLNVVDIHGAGYLTKKSVFFPRAAKKIDVFLQKRSRLLNRFGNSVVILAQR